MNTADYNGYSAIKTAGQKKKEEQEIMTLVLQMKLGM